MYVCILFSIHTTECAKKYFSNASEYILVQNELVVFADLNEEIAVVVLKIYVLCNHKKASKGKKKQEKIKYLEVRYLVLAIMTVLMN